jgi:hypothetical protein
MSIAVLIGGESACATGSPGLHGNNVVGLVDADTESFRRAGHRWHPQTTLSDLLTPVPWVKQPPRTS